MPQTWDASVLTKELASQVLKLATCRAGVYRECFSGFPAEVCKCVNMKTCCNRDPPSSLAIAAQTVNCYNTEAWKPAAASIQLVMSGNTITLG